eukprot:s3260_g9.t1
MFFVRPEISAVFTFGSRHAHGAHGFLLSPNCADCALVPGIAARPLCPMISRSPKWPPAMKTAAVVILHMGLVESLCFTDGIPESQRVNLTNSDRKSSWPHVLCSSESICDWTFCHGTFC